MDRLVVLKGSHIFLLKNIEEIHEFLDGFYENDLIFEKVFTGIATSSRVHNGMTFRNRVDEKYLNELRKSANHATTFRNTLRMSYAIEALEILGYKEVFENLSGYRLHSKAKSYIEQIKGVQIETNYFRLRKGYATRKKPRYDFLSSDPRLKSLEQRKIELQIQLKEIEHEIQEIRHKELV
ncbi:hypothetical protein [Helicobacter cetorum]|uniref:hypothetical protein n=1 Tax=Helicobacter cetorum TaxID=138563 RepID=UPI0012DE1B75|nr:hypothetical protein [Helicobacter cetorum]